MVATIAVTNYKKLPLIGNNAKTQTLAFLISTQAVALLGFPNEDRENFIA